MRYKKAPDVKNIVNDVVRALSLTYINTKQIVCIRSFDTKTRAIARIWGIPKIIVEAAGITPFYVIEVISQRYDRQSTTKKIQTVIHELMHVPKTFSGALLSHRGRHHKVNSTEVNKLFKKYKQTAINTKSTT